MMGWIIENFIPRIEYAIKRSTWGFDPRAINVCLKVRELNRRKATCFQPADIILLKKIMTLHKIVLIVHIKSNTVLGNNQIAHVLMFLCTWIVVQIN